MASALATDLADVHSCHEWPALQALAEPAVRERGSRNLAVLDCPTSRPPFLALGLDCLAELWKRAGHPQNLLLESPGPRGCGRAMS